MDPDPLYTVSISMAPFAVVLLALLTAGTAYLAAAEPRGRRNRAAPVPVSASHLLHRRLEHARLARMLRRMHVSPDVYLRRIHPDLLNQQLDTCAACPHVFQCDQALARPRSVDVDVSFCPNRARIAALRRAA